MATRLDSSNAGFEQAFETMLNARREQNSDVDATVRDIIADIRKRGDAALIDYTARFDRLRLDETTLRISAEETAAPPIPIR